MTTPVSHGHPMDPEQYERLLRLVEGVARGELTEAERRILSDAQSVDPALSVLQADAEKEIDIMNSVADTAVQGFDFDAAKRFVLHRARQHRRETRWYLALVVGVGLATIGVTVLRTGWDVAGTKLVNPYFLAVVSFMSIGLLVYSLAARYKIRHLERAARSGHEHSIRKMSEREARGVRSDRRTSVLCTGVAVVILLLLGIEAAIAGRWITASIFFPLAFGWAWSIRGITSMAARRLDERYIAGKIDDEEYAEGPRS